MAAAQLEQILARLLVPDNEVIKQATKDLQTVYRDPAIIYPLCEIMIDSQNPQIRQYAAVILRKKLVKIWRRVPAEDKERTKSLLLQCTNKEKVPIVLRSIAHLVSIIAKHELSLNQWNELNQFIDQSCSSAEPTQREIGMIVLSSLMETATSELQSKFSSLLPLFSAALDDRANKMVPFYALKSLTAMVEYVGSDELPQFQAMIPKIMMVIKAIIETDEDKACEAMELFDELVECDVGIVVPHLTTLIQFCLELASLATLGNSIRVKALSFVSWLITLKKKTLLRHGLLPTIIRTMLIIMSTPGEEEDEAVDEDSAESHSPVTLAGQVLDVLSLNLPPEKIYIPIMEQIQPLLQSTNKFEKSASLMAIAVVTEGCSEYIKNNHLTTLLQIVYNGVDDSERVVRNAALFAVGQFAEHLQPDISKYHSDLVPVLIRFMDAAILSLSTQPQEKTGITKIFYALETFCEQLGSGLVPYLPVLMEKFFSSITTTSNVHLQELVLSAFGATASACGEHISPYFSQLIQIINGFIQRPFHQDYSVLQSQAVDTLGTLARTIGEDTFRPLAPECIATGMTLMYSEDPDMRRSVYGMLASVSCILKEELGGHLEAIVQKMMTSLTSEEGVKVHYASFQVDFLDFDENDEDGLDESATSIEDDDVIEGFSVENAYLEEKEDTCNSLGEIAENVGIQFLPYFDDCFREVNILSEHSSEGIRKAAIWTLGRFIKTWYKFCNPEHKNDVEVLVNYTMSSFAAVIRTDSDKTVVMATLETLYDVLKPLKALSFPIEEKVVDSLMTSIQDILDNKAECQEDDDDLPGEGGVAEYDSFLEESAGGILGPLAGLAEGALFLSKFDFILPKLVKKLNGVNATASDKSFVVGTFGEILEGLGEHSRLMVNLYETFMKYSKADQEDEVCSNAIYGLGVLATNALPEMLSNYTLILQHLFIISQSTKSQNGRVMDNICAAICRMIMARQDTIPLEQVVPMLVQNLPLKEDMEENETVYGCIIHLFTHSNHVMMPHLQSLLRIFARELSSASKISKDLQVQIAQLLQALNTQCPDHLQSATRSLSPDELTILTSAIQLVKETGTSQC